MRRGWIISTSTARREAQERGFRAHIAAARATGLPLVIHTREADEDCGRILEDEVAKGPFRAVLHCYTGGRELAMKAIALGLSISFTGILTFKKSEALRELAAELPADRIMVETDSPYLAPGKFRGKRNEPSYVVEVAKVLAETRGVSLEEISRQTTENFFRLFSKVPRRRRRMTLTLTILGCGSSAGVPRPALGWGACDPNNPKNRRRRCSLLVERNAAHGTTRIVIDTSPDLREQLIDADVDHIDAVFLTHEHADQTHGIDDLRSVVLHQRRRIPGLFQPVDRQRHHGAVFLLLHLAGGQRLSADPDAPFDRGRREPHHRREGRSGHAVGLPGPARQHPGARLSHWRCRLYARPARHSATRAGRRCENLDLWIVDGLRYAGHPSHFSVSDALSWIERFKPKRAVITNMHSDLDYEVLRQSLPAGVIPAYDGMRLVLERAG